MNPNDNANMAEQAGLLQPQFIPFIGDATSMYAHTHQVSYYQSGANQSTTTYYAPEMDPHAYPSESGGNGNAGPWPAQGYIPGSHYYEGVPFMGCYGGIHANSQLPTPTPTAPIYLPSHTYLPCVPLSSGRTIGHVSYPPSYSYAVPSTTSPIVFRPPLATMTTPARASRSSAGIPTTSRVSMETAAALPSRREKRLCKFCKRNNETKMYYTSHKLIDDGKIACPVLRRYVCEICGQTGDNAHTKNYCPFKVASVDHADDEDHGDKYGGDETSKKCDKRGNFNYAKGQGTVGGYSKSKL